MSNKMKLYQILANLISLKSSLLVLSSECDVFMEDDVDESTEYLNDVLHTLLKYMPCITD